jgi:anti-sigma regulatory factor (Ser/Thr protein kinase)
MEMTRHATFAVEEASRVGAVRRAAADVAARLGFGADDVARVALVATELGTNLLKHAGHGEMLVQATEANGRSSVALIALDRGPGIANVTMALQDGVSSRGTAGTGLGAVARQATRFDVHSVPGVGTAVLAIVAPVGAREASDFDVGGVCVPYPGETVCGDGFAVDGAEGRRVVLVSDGLGHGTPAAEASARAATLFVDATARAPAEIIGRLHDGMRATRGAAGAVAEVNGRQGVVRYCGVGNIAATIVADGTTRSLVSHHGTLGHDARRIAQFQYPWPPGALLVLHSDGLVSHWTLERHPGLASRAALLIAAVLYRDFRRQRDDTTVVVLRGRS